MAVNRDKPDRWRQDIAQSVDMYNDWFVRFAPEAYRTTRVQTGGRGDTEGDEQSVGYQRGVAKNESRCPTDIADVYLPAFGRGSFDRSGRCFAESC